MLYIKDIFKASVCSFCENIYEENSIAITDFIEVFKSFLFEDNLQECLEICTSDISYDVNNIDNVCDNLTVPKYEKIEIANATAKCKKAFIQTLEVDKTINVEAFVDNLANEFSKN